MAYEFARLADVESLTEVPEGATVLAEVNGQVKRVPGSGLGGGGVKTAIIKSSNYDDAFTPAPKPMDAVESEITLECLNMTFDEAYQTMLAGEPLGVMLMVVTEIPGVVPGMCAFVTNMVGVPCLLVALSGIGVELFWTAEGLSAEPPSSGEA